MRSEVMPLSAATKIPGLRAVFGEVYPDPVRVISLGPQELQQVNILCVPWMRFLTYSFELILVFILTSLFSNLIIVPTLLFLR